MKVVIQSGKIVSKFEVEKLLELAPKDWVKGISSIVIFESSEEHPSIRYHPASEQFAVFVPNTYPHGAVQMMEFMAVHIQAVNQFGHLPKQLKKSLINEYTEKWSEISASSELHFNSFECLANTGKSKKYNEST